jgi:hypothetical protein
MTTTSRRSWATVVTIARRAAEWLRARHARRRLLRTLDEVLGA